ncbi:MAG: hypothetical protein Q9M50_09395 [Methylococcales bacterium]|nr:hypothetical protein [Methylococcales bacterium]
MGEKWLGAVPLIKIFSVYILFLSFSFADEPVLMIKGKIVPLNIVKLLMSLLLLVVGYYIVDKMGIIGMAMAYSVILSFYYVVLKIMTLESIEMSGKVYLQSMRRIFSYAIVLFSMTYLIWVGTVKNEFITLIGIGIAVTLIMGVMIIPYFKIITFKPLRFKIDNCLGIIKYNHENIFFAAFGLVILIAVVSFTYLNIIPVNPLQIATYQWLVALWN